jgi:predicted GNAT superfamily acetyltransferase
MTDQIVDGGIAAEAARRAARAAVEAGVTVIELDDIGELTEACRLLDRVWQPGPGNPLMTPELLRVFEHSGSYVVGVYQDESMVGVCVGILSDTGLHSHIAGVVDGVRGRSVGYAIKLHQRAWSLARGIKTITWTYDPLISRNAYFNLHKLGAVPVEYLADFYGAMHDSVNAGTETDRLMVCWDLTAEPGSETTCPESGVVGLDAKPDGRPVIGRRDGEVVLVRIPSDVETMRQADPQLAGEWRRALRDVLGELMRQGGTVTGFTRDGWYVFERGKEDRA